MFTKEETALAKPCYEAIKKIAERQVKKCSRCYGSGIMKVGHPRQTGGSWRTGTFHCDKCNGTGKVKGKWEWEPEVGECFYGLSKALHWIVNEKQRFSITQYIEKRKLTPLLHWEKIEEVLEGMGYKIWTTKYYWKDTIKALYECQISLGLRSEAIVDEEATTAQEAVRRAVIELGRGESE